MTEQEIVDNFVNDLNNIAIEAFVQESSKTYIKALDFYTWSIKYDQYEFYSDFYH